MTDENLNISSLLEYSPDTGVFKWKPRPRGMFKSHRSFSTWNARFAGNIAGSCNTNGYLKIRIVSRAYSAHRLAWLLYYGEFPKNDIDHKDGDKLNNRILNLRTATRSQNLFNSRVRRCGLKGVSKSKKAGRFVASIAFRGVKSYLGTFDSEEEAHEAYMRAAREIAGDFSRAV